jgi:predicted dehydrogenase
MLVWRNLRPIVGQFNTWKKDRLVAEIELGRAFKREAWWHTVTLPFYRSYNADWWGGWEDGRCADTGVSAMAVAGCHAIDALKWFVAAGDSEAAEPIEVFAYAGGRRKGTTRQFNPITNQWHEGTPLEYDGLKIALVRFANGVLGKVSVNCECIQPYTFPLEIFGDHGEITEQHCRSLPPAQRLVRQVCSCTCTRRSGSER